MSGQCEPGIGLTGDFSFSPRGGHAGRITECHAFRNDSIPHDDRRHQFRPQSSPAGDLQCWTTQDGAVSMDMLMCRGCGQFVPAFEADGNLTPVPDACPECDGVEFRDVQANTLVRADES